MPLIVTDGLTWPQNGAFRTFNTRKKKRRDFGEDFFFN